MKNRKMNTTRRPILFLGTILIASMLFISVGFSALSTTLSIDGSTSFVPVGLIRVLSIQQDTLAGVTEVNRSIKPDSIKNTLEFDSETGYATYEVVIKNLGQIDYVLDHIDEVVYSNNQIEYILDGYQIGNVIHAHEEKTFTVKFKYKNNIEETLVSRLNSELKFVFEEYNDDTSFKTVFNHEGACTFNGTTGITGTDCGEYEGRQYIDTGVSLYSEDNWQKDYEIGFTIDDYVPNQQVNQAVFVNAKNEVESLGFPGLVFRRDAATNNLEITQTIGGDKVIQKITNYSMPLDVKIFKIDNVIYYNINGGELTRLQDMSNFNQQFDVTTWFGAAPAEEGGAMRVLNATLSNMYIKSGKYTPQTYTITFEPNGGTLSETTKTVNEYTKVGSLPLPINPNGTVFMGWYSDSNFTNPVDENTIFNQDTILYARWADKAPVKMNNEYYDSVSEAVAAAPSDIETVITISSDLKDKITIPADKNIVFDFGQYTISNSQATFIAENNGILKIVSGKFTCSSATAAINNNNTGTMIISGGEIRGTGSKQAVYNDGGTLTITGNPLLTNTSNSRAAVHNLNHGTLNILGGTIISNSHAGVNNDGGTLTIGTNDGTINTTVPSIQGKTYGVTSTVNYTLYDGILRGINNAVNNQSRITTIADNSTITTGTEVINGTTYKTLYLQPTGQ